MPSSPVLLAVLAALRRHPSAKQTKSIRSRDRLASIITPDSERRRILLRLIRELGGPPRPSASELKAVITVGDLVSAIEQRKPGATISRSRMKRASSKKAAARPPKRAAGPRVRRRPARMGRNPATGEAIEIKASKKVAFRVARDLGESTRSPPKAKPASPRLKRAPKKTAARKPPVRKKAAAKKAAVRKGGGGMRFRPLHDRVVVARISGRIPQEEIVLAADTAFASLGPRLGRPLRQFPSRPRYANAALHTAEGDRMLEPGLPLERGHVVRLTVDIGDLSQKSQVRDATPLPSLPADPIFLDVMVSSTDFGVGRDTSAADRIANGIFFVSDNAQSAEAIGGRDGKYLDFYLRVPEPKGDAHAHARIGYYYRNILLQSQILTARFGTEPGFTIETDFTTSEDFTGLGAIPRRPRVSVLTNANDDGTHQIVLRHPEAVTTPAETIAIDGKGISDTIGRLRKALEARAPEASQRSRHDLIEDLKTLAPLGWQLYAQLPGQLKADFFGSWKDAPDKFVLQIARPTSSRFVAPWSYIYDIPLLKDAQYTLCPMVDGWDGRKPLFDGAPRRCPHGPHDEGNVLCPFGFWGYRYAIEQVARRKDTDGIVAIKVAAGGDVVAAQTQYDVDRNALAGHVGRLKALALTSPLKATLKEGKTKTEIQNLLGADLPFVYFYCHGERAYGSPDTHLGVGDHETIPAEDFIAWTRLWYARLRRVIWGPVRPLIFINACHSVAIEPGTLVSYVDAFVGTGQAAGVIGTEVKVSQSLAMEAAEGFSADWLSGKRTVEEALRTMRMGYLSKGNLFGLAYTPYCWSELKLVAS